MFPIFIPNIAATLAMTTAQNALTTTMMGNHAIRSRRPVDPPRPTSNKECGGRFENEVDCDDF